MCISKSITVAVVIPTNDVFSKNFGIIFFNYGRKIKREKKRGGTDRQTDRQRNRESEDGGMEGQSCMF